MNNFKWTQTVLKGIVKTSYESGYAEGEVKGRVERNVEIVRNLKQMGFQTQDIVKITGLSEKEIEELSLAANNRRHKRKKE
ncbi:MAG: hypothetical protein LBU65_04105 [Planctomycetaceae bacterium]|nr:hypothetical protein [Planctomycetaceae bacterium]